MTKTLRNQVLVLGMALLIASCGTSGAAATQGTIGVAHPTTVAVTPFPTNHVPEATVPPATGVPQPTTMEGTPLPANRVPEATVTTPARDAAADTSPADLRERWLHGIPCPSPCWEGITPGTTSLAEAIALLKTKPFITSMVLTPTRIYKDVDFFSWDYADDQGRGIGEYDLTAPNHTILSFSPGFPIEGPLRDIITYYGEPSHIIATARYVGTNDISYFIVFVYVSHGFFVSADVDSSDAVLNDDMAIFSVGMFPANTHDIAHLFRRAQIQPQDVAVWQGFKPFRFYCRAVDGSDACQK